MSRIAVVLFNLGGPDSLDAVEPFLRNLFSDPAIIGAPAPIRFFLSRFIARRRGPTAREIYRQMGGRSPIVPQTEAQAKALATALAGLGEVRTFIVMRYWAPRSREVAEEVAAFRPDRVILLPLYPQFSTATTASSLADWRAAAARARITVPMTGVCCYPLSDGLAAAQCALITPALEAAAQRGTPRLLLSAHGLPKRIVARGDPYQWQVEQTAKEIVQRLDRPDLDWAVCYQSRVGPLAWIEPSTEAEIARAGRDGVPVVLAPIAFVSEHSETLVELDIEYRALAEREGVPHYARVPAVGTHPAFIEALAKLVRDAVDVGGGGGLCCGQGRRICPSEHVRCALASGDS